MAIPAAPDFSHRRQTSMGKWLSIWTSVKNIPTEFMWSVTKFGQCWQKKKIVISHFKMVLLHTANHKSLANEQNQTSPFCHICLLEQDCDSRNTHQALNGTSETRGWHHYSYVDFYTICSCKASRIYDNKREIWVTVKTQGAEAVKVEKFKYPG